MTLLDSVEAGKLTLRELIDTLAKDKNYKASKWDQRYREFTTLLQQTLTFVEPETDVQWFTEFGHLNRGDMLTSEQHRCSNEKRNFSAEFKRESAQLVVDQNYTVADAAKAMDVGLSTMTRWVKQLRDERQGKTPKTSPITPEQIEIRELRKKLQRIEMENEILKRLPRS